MPHDMMLAVRQQTTQELGNAMLALLAARDALARKAQAAGRHITLDPIDDGIGKVWKQLE
jgi:hypothetical protein